MKNLINNRALTRLLLLLVTLSILLSSLTSCKLLSIFSYVADSDEEIENNVSDTIEHIDGYYVCDYLRDWGMPIFNKVKFKYFEECLTQLYNYENGMPNTLDHAKKTAELFLANYSSTVNKDDTTAVTDALLDCYVSALDDPYAFYRPPVETEDYMNDMSGKFGGIGVMIEYDYQNETIMVNTVYPESPAEKAGIKVGDFIYAIDGKTVTELGLNNAVYHVRGEIGTPVELELIRNGEHITLTAIRDEVEELNVTYEIDEENNIGYVQIVAFKENTFSQFKDAIDSLKEANVDGIIFDLRGNPGGYVKSVVDVISYIVPDGVTVISYQYKGQKAIELIAQDDGDDHSIDIPCVVICNEYTASAGEIFTSAVRDYRNDGQLTATIIGTTTYGKGIMQSTYYYPLDQSTVTFTVAYYNPPCGENYHEIGIVPDVVVELEGATDTQLEAAVNELIKLINDN